VTGPGSVGSEVDAARSVVDVLDLFERHARQRYDEQVTQLDHALQTAALARTDGASDALVAAALLHDVGHLLALRDGTAADGQTTVDLEHEARGARWLARVFPPSVTGPIALHVAAKRYRCAVDPAYHAALSPGSQASLERQGGPMTAAEVARFEANPAHVDAVRLRGWDDGGKRTDGVTVPTLADHVPLLERLAR
jgi:phosphonate degradation associated HDIG domain protein